jgi:lipopolysaccharide export LptBFGC system permease protein LptF
MYKSIRNLAVFAIFWSVSFVTLAQENYTEQKAGNTIFLSIPNYFVKTTSLNDDATLQYMNAKKEAYVIVIDDSKKLLEDLGTKYDGVADFHDGVSKELIAGLKNPVESERKSFMVGKNKYSQSVLNGQFTNSSEKEMGITYLLTYVETDENFYQILCWSTAELYSKLEPDYLKIVKTLREGDCK